MTEHAKALDSVRQYTGHDLLFDVNTSSYNVVHFNCLFLSSAIYSVGTSYVHLS